MGLNTTWIAIKGIGKDRLLETLGLIETGEPEGWTIAKRAIAELPGEWTIVHFGDFHAIKPEFVAARFPNGRLIWGTSSETVMWSGAYGLLDGAQTWAVEHNGCDEPPYENVSGSPPGELDAIAKGLARKQAEPGNEDVDFLFAAPMALTAALCGYDPMRQYDDVDFRVVEPALDGAAGERQRTTIGFQKRLIAAVESDLIPAAQKLGFKQASDLPDDYPKASSPTMQVRFRDGLSEIIDFSPDWRKGAPQIAINLFVRKGTEFRKGRGGTAVAPAPRRSFIDIIRGRKEDPEQALARSVREGLETLDVVDRYLKAGTPHAHLTPPDYEKPLDP